MGRITNAMRESIAKKAIEDTFIKGLKASWEAVRAALEVIVYKEYDGLTRDASGPFEEYIDWTRGIVFDFIPDGWCPKYYQDAFSSRFCLPRLNRFEPLSREIPSQCHRSDIQGKKNKDDILKILRPYVAQRTRAEKAYEDLKQVMLGISTTKQLEETIPELAKYLPVTAQDEVRALVPIDQINRVRAMFSASSSIPMEVEEEDTNDVTEEKDGEE